MESDGGVLLKFIEENAKDMIRYCTSIEEKKVEDEIEGLINKIRGQLIDNPRHMANSILMTVALLSYEKIEKNEVSKLEGYTKLKENLKLMDEILNEENEEIKEKEIV
ncbi:hypothetical protein [Clostridium perfringens]|uniref:hypothetical protein n=1 Tax=Clostridium perfringens TaxID=1502 RepID=UPI001E5294C0|nr:hypothetical protein [Clostridium perfringens]MCC5421367.1 hypothetical protein [Clostridium perfringens]MCC5430827.1 hypothetical protein [Clostridium perfringens]MCC5445297.1 hypothetical protein [Clostridium perfringens]MCC5448274.1 hypothetical protein [Clostridium perfringens]MDK0792758.1 hypothetical protein [Clostridium perfringens]